MTEMLDLNTKPPQPMRALIGHDVRGNLTVLATDSQQIAFDCDELSSCCEDIGLGSDKDCPERGLYLWTGTSRIEVHGAPWDCQEAENVYEGTFRKVDPSEVAALYAMVPPEPVYPEDDRETVQPGDERYLG